jgi:hypothetical protein
MPQAIGFYRYLKSFKQIIYLREMTVYLSWSLDLYQKYQTNNFEN